MNARKRRFSSITAVGMAVGFLACATPSQRMDSLEERMAKLETQEQRLAAVEGKLDSVDALAVQVGTLAQTMDNLASQMQLLAAAIDDAPPARAAAPPRPSGPDADTVYAVPIAGNPSIGPKHAKVTLVTGFEFACPFCERTRATMDQLRNKYGKDLKIVYKHFIVHPANATPAAHAACAAGLQGKFEPMYDAIWDEAFANREFSAEKMEALARKVGLKMKRFRTDRDGACKQLVKNDQAELTRLGVRGTPSFFINGRFLSGARPLDQFETLIDEELAKASKAIAGGIKLRDYYDGLVDSGVKSVD